MERICGGCGSDISMMKEAARVCSERCRSRRRREEDPEGRRAAGRASTARYRVKNIEAVRAKGRQRYQDHIVELRAKSRVYKRAKFAIDPEKYRAAYRKWHSLHPEDVRAKNHKRRARLQSAEGSFTVAEWAAIVKRQCGRCAICGVKTKLTVDHIIPLGSGGCSFAYNIQGLCGPCNCRKQATMPGGVSPSLFDKVQIAVIPRQ